MEEILYATLTNFSTWILLVIIAISLYVLGKGADILVDEAVNLSIRWGVPKLVVGATIVSLGTTLPEATVSVLAAIKGNPDLALGNAIGSIIANTALIIGLAAIIGRLPADKKSVKRQGNIQILSAAIFTIMALPFFSKSETGIITQKMGIGLVILLIIYIIGSIQYARNSNHENSNNTSEEEQSAILTIFKLAIGIVLVILSSKVLIPTVEITAIRVGVPQSVIAATLVAFGTSLPELVTAITAVRQGHGELAVGNIIGADILNILFVIGSGAAVTKEGLVVPANFYILEIPVMLIVLVSFNIFARNKDGIISKLEGLFLVGIYILYLVMNYILL
ncbi:MAG: calcium/sodium antiporter [Tissierellia bacterium]|nr:calcium/sodium antiporter [Tissierellia bacterium]